MHTTEAPWWQGSVIYQVYPRSFSDSNDDGIGDLRGIAARLDHIAALGVDGIWLSPFFRSPMKDFGYDVADYCDVDPMFGTLDDFRDLRRAAHARGLKLIIDQVWSHTSDQHAWFAKSRTSRSGDYADWYVWADAMPDGGPPNNWLSVFGGPAWTWDTRRRQYYLHNFLTSQPDLNFHCPAVRRAILNVARFWLDEGVDGFRLDVANLFYCDAALRPNPPKPAPGNPARPYTYQQHIFDKSRPETLSFVEDLRALMDAYPDRMAVAEIFSDQPIARAMEYTLPGRLHTAYSFHFLEKTSITPALVEEALAPWAQSPAWPSWSFSNHDVVRAPSRFGAALSPDAVLAFAQLLNGLLLCLRGTIFLYQGEELGLPQARVPFERLQDPEGIAFWPDNLGRDGCRTPMPWQAGADHAGFSAAEPWLPVDPRHHGLAVDQQQKASDSMMHITAAMIRFRQQSDVLRRGDLTFVKTEAPLLVFDRQLDGAGLRCVFNMGDTERQLSVPPAFAVADFGTGPFPLPHRLAGNQLTVPAFGGAVLVQRR